MQSITLSFSFIPGSSKRGSIIISRMSNHLVNSSSPYLLQHAENPVDWYPWGPEALEKARRENKPIFLSIGYAACHWCHVMAHESFEDPDIASVMNANFVNIKVDREERPDLDSIYMSFIVAVTGQGGWPMSVFLTPEGKPFYGGTYFPPRRMHNLPSFQEVLEAIARLWKEDRSRLISNSEDLAAQLQAPTQQMPGSMKLEKDSLSQVTQAIAKGYDRQNGGWGGAPKFPQPMLVEFLLRQATRGDQTSLDMAIHTLTSMAQGGMYDILGGGFARYSVDPTWLIPHFEKMLYDNAQLALVYLHAYQLTGNAFFRQICESTLDFVLRELAHPAGGFFSSLDADSDGGEGKYYLWTPDEIRAALPEDEDAELFMDAYGVTQEGNFEGKNILRHIKSDEELAGRFNIEVNDVHNRLVGARKQLLEIRSSRKHPNTDDKVLVSWNALMLTACAEAGRVLGRQDYFQAAVHNADFIQKNMVVQGRLMRSWRDGTANHDGYLEDHAGMVLALVSLYQSDPNPQWFQAAIRMADQIREHFRDPAGGYFDTPDDHENLLFRPKDMQDNATPSGNALAANALFQLATYQGRSEWRTIAEEMLSSNWGMMMRYPTAFGMWLCAVDFAVGPVQEVAILGELSDPATQSLVNALWQGYHPRLLLASSPHPPLPGSPDLLNERPLLNGKPTANVCQRFVCLKPVNTPADLLGHLEQQFRF